MNPLNLMDGFCRLYDILPASQPDTKQFILEPMTTILKISLLQWFPEGTKLSVIENSLYYNEPSLIQGVRRTWGGDSRQDLHNLYNPILKCLEWYPRDNPRYSLFYSQCQLGLEALRSSYTKQSLINHTIDHYIGLLGGKEYEVIEDTSVTQKLREFWTEDELTIAETMMKLTMNKDHHEMYHSLFQTMLQEKEKQVYSYIQTITTTY